MKTKIFFTACLVLLLSLNGCTDKKKKLFSLHSPITEVAFDDSMKKSEQEFNLIFTHSDDVARYTKIKEIYEKNLPSKVKAGLNTRIPKILHQIWIGPKIPPAYLSGLSAKLKALHPGWEYHLWNDESLAELNLDNWDLVERSQNWAEKADIIRASLLEKFGGVYLDEDFEVFSALDELHEKYDFYAGLEYPHKVLALPNHVWVGISIMACCPHHPIMKNWKQRIRDGWDKTDLLYSSQVERIVNHTFIPFTHAVMQEIDRPGNVDIVFPATYFYPLSDANASKRRSSVRAWREKFYDFLETMNLRKSRPYSKIYDESIGVHYWGNLWRPSAPVQLQDMHVALDCTKQDLYNMQKKLRLIDKRLSDSEQRICGLVSAFDEREAESIQTEQTTNIATIHSFNSDVRPISLVTSTEPRKKDMDY